MKQIILALLLATPALAGGVYDDQAGSASTGAANVPVELAGFSIGGSSVPNDDAIVLRAEVQGSGTVQFLLRGVDVLVDPWPIVGSDILVQLEIWRTGTTTAMARPWFGVGGGNEPLVPGGRFPVTGLAWGQAQALSIVGKSPVAGGITLQRAGLLK